MAFFMGTGMFWVYVLENRAGKLYVRHTDDLDRRISEHNAPDRSKSKYTAKSGPWRPLWSEPHPNGSDAMKRENFSKSRKSAAWIRQYLLEQ